MPDEIPQHLREEIASRAELAAMVRGIAEDIREVKATAQRQEDAALRREQSLWVRLNELDAKYDERSTTLLGRMATMEGKSTAFGGMAGAVCGAVLGMIASWITGGRP